jgi:dTDP-4-amino-4,6-dideoxygalactose transaminase
MNVRFLNLSIRSKKEINLHLKTYKNFLKKGVFVLGKSVENFEKKIGKRIGKKYNLGCSSGTNALYLALKSLDLKENDHVLVPCLSWVSTFTAVKMAGAQPVGVDIGNDFQIDIKSLKKRITKKTKAIIIVYFTGFYKLNKEIKKICKKKKIKIIEDCAQSFGAHDVKQDSVCGNFGDISCFSMNPMKVYGAFGDAGLTSTNDPKIYSKMESLRYVGTKNKELVIYPNLNHKIDTLQAEVLMQNLKLLSGKIKNRINNASYYDKNLTNKIVKPIFFKNKKHIYYTYSILVKNRNKLVRHLSKKGIETKIQHPYIICDHPGLKNIFNNKKDFPNGNKIKDQILSIPIHEKLSKKEIAYVSETINRFYNT